jgi:hypothetical protein
MRVDGALGRSRDYDGYRRHEICQSHDIID